MTKPQEIAFNPDEVDGDAGANRQENDCRDQNKWLPDLLLRR